MFAIIAGVTVAIIVAGFLFKPMFGDKDGFIECVKFWLTPDIISMFRGEHGEDWYAEMKLGLWLGLGALFGFGTFFGINSLLG